MSHQLNKRHLRKEAEKAARDIKHEMDEVHGPYWKSRADLAQLLISLSSVILVGTITFSESLLGSATGQTKCVWVLIGSWAFLLLCLVFGILCIWFNAMLFSFHPRFINLGPELEKRLDSLDPKSESMVQDMLGIVGEISTQALEPVGRADRWSFRALVGALLTFVLGILAFIVFGSFQLLK